MKISEMTCPYKIVCDNCFTNCEAYKNTDGCIAVKCPVCGTKIKMRRLTRRCVVKELRFPDDYN